MILSNVAVDVAMRGARQMEHGEGFFKNNYGHENVAIGFENESCSNADENVVIGFKAGDAMTTEF